MSNPDLERYLDRQDNEWLAYHRAMGLSEKELKELAETCPHDFRDEHECWICGKVFD